MNIPFEIALLYKSETGVFPVEEVETSFTCWRSRGQWVIDISDAERLRLGGLESEIQITRPDEEFIQWLYEKVLEQMKK